METLINYLDNMFRNLPNTNQMLKLKEEILANMEDKYLELKKSGKTENEAIGIVISEFGNIDELMEEFEIEEQDDEEFSSYITEEQVDQYLEMNKRSATMIGLGVALCIIAPAMLIWVNHLISIGIIEIASQGFRDIAGLIPFFLLVAVAIALFIYAGMKMENYKSVDKGVQLPPVTKSLIRQKQNDFQSTYVMSVIVGVVILILSPFMLIVISAFGENASGYGVVVLLSMVAIGIYVFVYFGMIRDGYRKLLKVGEYSTEQKEQNRMIAAVSVIIWPLAVCIFLITGFIYEAWGINWLIFPIVALLFSMFSGAYKILKTK